MSLIPEFELGIWNAWILILLLFFLVLVLTPLITRVMFMSNEQSGDSRRSHNPSGLFTPQEKRVYNISMVITFVSYLYSIFVPLKLGTDWLYAGLLVYVIGMLFGIMAQIGFATPPLDEPATTGIYRISRNPMYLSYVLIYLGISLACLSWIYLLIAIIVMIVDNNVLVIAEERWCLEHYGDAYRAYPK